MAEPAAPPARDPQHSQIVLRTIGIWIVAHIVIALAFGLPGLVSCQPSSGIGSCGVSLGLVFFLVGLVQVVYGAVAAAVLFRSRPAVAQGMLIALSIVVVLFTVVCFGTAAVG